MPQDIKSILSSVNFFSGEMNGSEASKTKEEKELIYGKFVIRGRPIDIFLKCQRMTDFGGVDAESTKKAFCNAFFDVDHMPEAQFNKLMISVSCADGASVNMGRLSGACVSLKTSRPWLLRKPPPRFSHRRCLTLLCNAAFLLLDEMMVNVFYLFHNSGKNKRILRG